MEDRIAGKEDVLVARLGLRLYTHGTTAAMGSP